LLRICKVIVAAQQLPVNATLRALRVNCCISTPLLLTMPFAAAGINYRRAG
jgi:hypothetical protein